MQTQRIWEVDRIVPMRHSVEHAFDDPLAPGQTETVTLDYTANEFTRAVRDGTGGLVSQEPLDAPFTRYKMAISENELFLWADDFKRYKKMRYSMQDGVLQLGSVCANQYHSFDVDAGSTRLVMSGIETNEEETARGAGKRTLEITFSPVDEEAVASPEHAMSGYEMSGYDEIGCFFIEFPVRVHFE